MRRRDSWAGIAVAAVLAIGGAARAAEPAKTGSVAARYKADCARCHGETGKGDGEDGLYYTTKPTDFTAATPTPKRTDDFLAAVITDGGPSKGLSADMPAFKLPPAEVKALVAMIRQFAPGGPSKQAK